MAERIITDYGEVSVRPAREPDYESMCMIYMGMTWCEQCGNDELTCDLTKGHTGPHYARDSHHWEDVYQQPEPDDERPTWA